MISLKKMSQVRDTPTCLISCSHNSCLSASYVSDRYFATVVFPGVLKEGFSSLQKALNPSPSTMLVCLIRSQAHIRAIASVQRCHFAVFMTRDLKAVIRLSFGNSLASSSLTASSGSSWCSLHFENLLCWRVEHVVS